MLRTTDEKPFEKFRSKMKDSGGWDLLEFASAQKGAAIAHGWVNDFTLERLPWGFSCEALDEEPVAPNKQKFSSPDRPLRDDGNSEDQTLTDQGHDRPLAVRV